MRLSNPLRYPGSKSKLSAYIENFILDNDLQKFTIYEPYAGSASISLSLLQKNLVKKAVLIELLSQERYLQCIFGRLPAARWANISIS